MSAQVSRHSWPLSLTMEAPFLFPGLDGQALGVDKSFVRDQHGRICIPGEHLKGHFAHFLGRVAELEKAASDAGSAFAPLVPEAMLKNWFGAVGSQFLDRQTSGGADGDRARLFFRDLGLAATRNGKSEPGLQRTRIRIDRERGHAKAAHWLVAEQIAATGAKVAFSSAPPAEPLSGVDEGAVLIGTEEEASAFEAAFAQFALWQSQIGAMRSAGFGRIVEKTLLLGKRSSTPFNIPDASIAQSGTVAHRFNVRLDAPFLIDPILGTGNVQLSSSDIPGAAIKAALADAGRLADPAFDAVFAKVLSALVISNARRVQNAASAASRALPRSIVRMGKRIADGFDATLTEPLKDFSDLKTAELDRIWLQTSGFNELTPGTMTRTRTAVTEFTESAAEAQLFSYRLINPAKQMWAFEVAIPRSLAADEEKLAKRLLAFIATGALHVGKTKSRLITVELVAGTQPPVVVADGAFRITLESDARLLADDDLDILADGGDMPAIYAGRLKALLKTAAASAGIKIELDAALDWQAFDLRCSHRLAGGVKAIRAAKATGTTYRPFVLTSRGSVFRLPVRATNDGKVSAELRKLLDHVALYGLPSPEPDWKKNPFVPQNGFGAVSISGDGAREFGNVSFEGTP
jgi:CRISPR/Cas system CSM-associated protein Csm3 (group 7 of RAMP superfamily)